MHRPALALALVLAACSAPPEVAAPPEILEVAGLTADQVVYLDDLGVPVVVPGAIGAFRLVGLEAERRDVSRSATRSTTAATTAPASR